MLKAVSLTQPYATLIAIDAKRIETRSWSTSYRGPIAIHAAKGLGPTGGMRGLKEQCGVEPFYSALNVVRDSNLIAQWVRQNFALPLMPLGAIVATANLVHCLSTNGGYFKMSVGNFEMQNGRITSGEVAAVNYEKPLPGTNEFAFGNYSANRSMWFLEDIKPLARPVECKGALSLWTVPSEIEEAIKESLKA